MYYHVVIELNEIDKRYKKNKEIASYDFNSKENVFEKVFFPYFQEKKFYFSGMSLNNEKILRIKVRSSTKKLKALQLIEEIENSRQNNFYYISTLPQDKKDINLIMYDKHTEDVTNELFEEAQKRIEKESNQSPMIEVDKIEENTKDKDLNKVFIVHGQDSALKLEVARLIERQGLEAIILHEQVNQSLTIIEKIEKYSNVGYGVVLYTPCDKGGLNKENSELKPRARQNVVLEHGYLLAKLGRENVAAIVKGDVETPSDINGVLYIPYNGDWRIKLCREMQSVGYDIDMNKI